MKKLMISSSIILMSIMMTTTVLNKGEKTLKATIKETIEHKIEEIKLPEQELNYELEVVDEYILAMEGFMC